MNKYVIGTLILEPQSWRCHLKTRHLFVKHCWFSIWNFRLLWRNVSLLIPSEIERRKKERKTRLGRLWQLGLPPPLKTFIFKLPAKTDPLTVEQTSRGLLPLRTPLIPGKFIDWADTLPWDDNNNNNKKRNPARRGSFNRAEVKARSSGSW